MSSATYVLKNYGEHLSLLIQLADTYAVASPVTGKMAVDQMTKQALMPAGTQSLEIASLQSSPLLCEVDRVSNVTPCVMPADPADAQRALCDQTVVRWQSAWLGGVMVSTSLQNVARVITSPALVDEMSHRVRGLDVPWTGPLAVLVPYFEERVRELVQDFTALVRLEAERHIHDCYVRFVDWLARLRLPCIRDVLLRNQAYAGQGAENAIFSMTPEDFFQCMRSLRTAMEQMMDAAIQNFIACYSERAEIFNKPAVRDLMKRVMTTVAQGYLRFRYAEVLFMQEAHAAVLGYLTCTDRVAYAGILPNTKMGRSNKKTASVPSKIGVQRTAADPLPDFKLTDYMRDIYRYVFHVASGLRELSLYHDAMPLVLENRLPNGIHGAAGALAMCFLWRWVSMIHCLPLICDSSTAARSVVVGSLTPFLHPHAPCVSNSSGAPSIAQIMNEYLIHTLRPSHNSVCPVSPYVDYDRHMVPLYVCASNSDEKETRKYLNRRYKRRETTVIKRLRDVGDKPRNKRVRKTWMGNELQVIKPPKMYANPQTEPQSTKETDTTYSPPILPPGDVADMPALSESRPPAYAAITKPSSATKDHFYSLLEKHATISEKHDANAVRMREFVGLVVYHANHCQSVEPGLVFGVTARNSVATALVTRRMGGKKASRSKNVVLRDNSELAPLAKVVSRKRTIDNMLLEHRTSVLHQ